MPLHIVPTMLVSTPEEWQERVERIRGVFDRVQIDVIDGKFAETKTLNFSQMTGAENFQLDLHLMVEEPINWVEKCRRLNAGWVTGQIEWMSDQMKFVEMVKMGNMKAGLALDLDTKLDQLDKTVLSEIDQLLLMSVKAGFSGQLFDKKVLPKIEAARKVVGPEVEIGVDGGINVTNVGRVAQAGADVAYVGSALWQTEDVGKKLEELKAAAKLTKLT